MLSDIDKTGFLVLLIVLTLLVMFYLWQGWQVIHLRQEIDRLKEELVPVEERNRELRITYWEIFSLDRIERIARERLDMVEPRLESEEGEGEGESEGGE